MYNNTNNANNGNRDSFSATTSLVSFFDRNSCQFRLSGMDTGLTVAIWEPYVDPASGRKTYPKERRFSVLLTIERVMTLDNSLNEILEAYKKGEDYSIGVFTNNARDKIFEVSVRNGEFFASIHLGVDPATLIPRHTSEFKFEKTNIITGYNRESGQMQVNDIDGYFYLFNKLITDYVSMGGSGMPGHAVRNTNKVTTDKIFKYLESIAKKVGVTVENSYSNNSASNYNNNYGNNVDYNAQQRSNEPSPSYNEVNSLEGLL